MLKTSDINSLKLPSARQSRATIFTVAETAGVSIATVSNILNQPGKYRYSKDSAKRVHEACEKLGYKPSFMARSLAKQTNPAIGLLCGFLDDLNVIRVVDRAVELAAANDLHVILASKPDKILWKNLLAEERVQWLVAISYTLEDLEKVVTPNFLNRIIAINPDLTQRSRLPAFCITWDTRRQGILVVEHLADLGHKEIAILAGFPKDHATSYPRIKGSYERGQELGMKMHWIVNLNEDRHDIPASGRIMVQEVLANYPQVTAIICRQDYHAIGAYYELHKAGKRIPQDMAVVGHFNLQEKLYFHPPLTSTDAPLVEGVEKAMEFITSKGSSVRDNIMDLTDHIRLIARESTMGTDGGMVGK